MLKLFGWLIFLTGIFAILGGLYTWGDGNIFTQNELAKVLIPWSDILFTGPASLIIGYALVTSKSWGIPLGYMISGVYILGSFLVFISMVWNNHYAWYLIIPATSGLIIGTSFVIFGLSGKIIK